MVAVPTSAVQTTGSVSYVTELDKGTLTRKVIKVGHGGRRVHAGAVGPVDRAERGARGLRRGGAVVEHRDEHLRAVSGAWAEAAAASAAVASAAAARFAARAVGRRLRGLTRGWARRSPAATTAPERYGGAMAPIRLDQINLVVSDVPASRAFYSRLGLDFGDEADPVWDSQHVSARHGESHSPRPGSRQRAVRRQVEPGCVRAQRAPSSDSRWTVAPRSTRWCPLWPPTASPCSRSPTTPSGVPATPS